MTKKDNEKNIKKYEFKKTFLEIWYLFTALFINFFIFLVTIFTIPTTMKFNISLSLFVILGMCGLSIFVVHYTFFELETLLKQLKKKYNIKD